MTTPTSATSQAPSYKTNVNRAKTKRWVEAKSYTYDGDDWGEVDDYDEYPGYEEPPPPTQPVKPTGLRTQGQTMNTVTDGDPHREIYQSPMSVEAPNIAQQGLTQTQQDARRPATNPAESLSSGRGGSPQRSHDRRSPSFDAMNQGSGPQGPGAGMSASSQHLPRNRGPIQQPYQSSVDNQMRPRRPSQPGLIVANAPRDLHQTQNDRPNDWRPPYSGAGPAAPPHPGDFPPSSMAQSQGGHEASPPREGQPPPRKSSLGQYSQPNLPFDPYAPPAGSAFKPRERKESSASTSSTPFIRPADIYKRIEEEREKERQSQESKRPNLETVLGKAPAETSTVQSATEAEPEPAQPTSEPVQERKGEYNYDSFDSVTTPPPFQHEGADATKEKRRTTSKTFEIPKSSKSAAATLSPSLTLPDPTRMSGFGLGFGESFMNDTDTTSRAHAQRPSGSGGPSGGSSLSKVAPSSDLDLHHRPSKGFTSAVHQAFDSAQDQVPPTPSSTADSSIGRSTSGGTNAVSPIMSRGPSAVDRDRAQELPSIDDVTTPTQEQEGTTSHTRPRASGSFATVTPSTQQTSNSESFNEPPPPGFKVGHRRSSGTPSPDNSPAKTPMLASMSHLRRPQEVDFAEATPTPTESAPSVSESLRESDHSSSPERPSMSQRTDTSGSGRVKGLAEKFEGTPRPDSAASNTTPRASMLASGSAEVPPQGSLRPANDRLESFRPALPGGWQSSASLEPTSASRNHLDGTEPTPSQGPPASGRSFTNTTSTGAEQAADIEKDDPSGSAFQAAKEAGNALAGSLVAAVGMNDTSGSKTQPVTQPAHGSDSKEPSTQSGDAMRLSNQARPRNESSSPSDHTSSKDEVSTGHATKQPSSLPPLQTKAPSGEYESDRLRREIVRELSPGMRSNPTTATSDSPYQPSSRYTTNDSVRSNGGLPSEYDSYWNDGSEDGVSVHSETGLSSGKEITQQVPKPAPLAPQSANGSKQQLPLVNESEHASLPKESPPNLTRRFSWEEPLVDLQHAGQASKPSQSHGKVHPHDSASEVSHDFPPVSTAASMPRSQTEPDSENDRHVNVRDRSDSVPQPLAQLPAESSQGKGPERGGSFEYADGLEPVTNRSVDGIPRPRPVIEEQSVCSGATLLQAPEQPAPADEASIDGQTLAPRLQISPAPPPPSSMPKLPPFRELMSLKSPQERIHAFNNVQREFASMNTGLEHWLATTFNTLPEHQDLLQSSGKSGLPVKGSHASPSGLRTQGQPYYQQYLDASQQSPSSTSAQASASGSNPQGLSPSGAGGKISTQQVQAKGKEFLRSAGVVGGKANVAAKGLFSKGRSKLRDASSSKKAPMYSTSTSNSPRTYAEQTNAGPPSAPHNSQSLQPSGEGSEREVASEQSTHSQLADDERSVASNAEKSDRLPRSSKIFRKRDHSEKRKSKPREMFEAFKQEFSASSKSGSRSEPSAKSHERSRLPDEEAPVKPDRSETSDAPPATESVLASSPHHYHEIGTIDRRPESGYSQAARHTSYGSSTPVSGRLPIQLQDEEAEHVDPSQLPPSFHDAKPDSVAPVKTRSRELTQSSHNTALEIPRPQRNVEQPDENFVDQAERQSLTKTSPNVDHTPEERPEGSSAVSPDVSLPLAMPARGRHAAPMHYGLEHNFMPEGDFETQKRRSQSFSRPFRQSESRSRSRGSQAQRTPTHQPSLEETMIPADFYPNSISREEAFMPRSQTSEYAIEGIGPPELPPKESKAQSRRGSRSSAFFKSLTRTFTDSDSPGQQPNSEHADGSPAASSSNLDGKSKRSSIFGLPLRRSRTEMALEKDLPMRPAMSREPSSLTQLPAPAPPTKDVVAEEDDEFPMRPKQRQRTSSTISRKFQRSTTNATKELDPAKKNRFSAIGSLFSKANSKRRTSSGKPGSFEQSQMPPPHRPVMHEEHATNNGPQPALEYYTPPPKLDNHRVDSYYAPRRDASQDVSSRHDTHATTTLASESLANAPQDRPAYVQDATARSPGSPPTAEKHSSVDFLRKFSIGAKQDDQSGLQSNKSKHPTWNRFSRQKPPPKHEPSKSPSTKPSAPLQRESLPTSELPPLQTDGETVNRSSSPPPPPPPPKDEWHLTSPRRSSLAANMHPTTMPSVQSPSDMTHQRPFQGLPPLQTDVAMSPIKSGMTSPATGTSAKRAMTFEEKRRSRQWELEHGHMSPMGSEGFTNASPREHTNAKPLSPAEKRRSRQMEIETAHLASVGPKATSAGSKQAIGGLRHVEQDRRQEEDEPVRMSATSFPGEQWAPDHAYTWQDQ